MLMLKKVFMIILLSAVLSLAGCISVDVQPTSLPVEATIPLAGPDIANTATVTLPTDTLAPVPIEPTATMEIAPSAEMIAEGKLLVEERCTVCHDLGRIEGSQKSREQWTANVARMIGHGAVLSDAEQVLVIEYLAITYP